jgi:hypothetical protein
VKCSPPPDVARAKQLRMKIAQWGGANNAEDMDVIEHFFDNNHAEGEINLEVDDDESDPEHEQEPYFNPLRVETPTFVRQASSTSDAVQPSASRILQSSPIVPPFATGTTLGPQPLSSGTFEVSRRHLWMFLPCVSRRLISHRQI